MTCPTKISKLVSDQELLDLYKTGMTLEEIGQYFGVTRERIRQKLNANPLIQGQYRTTRNQLRAAREQQRNAVMTCPICGKEFKKGRQTRKACSRACFGKYTILHPRAKFQAKIEEEQTGFKRCSGCQTIKSVSEFHPKYGYTLKRNGTRYNSRCKKCQSVATEKSRRTRELI